LHKENAFLFQVEMSKSLNQILGFVCHKWFKCVGPRLNASWIILTCETVINMNIKF